MSNMMSVKSALSAEIKHAKEGIAFYSTRIATLEKMIAQLDQLDGKAGLAPIARTAAKKTSTRSVKAQSPGGGPGSFESSNAESSPAGKTTSPAVKTTSKLPATTAQFWLGLLSQTPVSNKEIIKSATAALKIRPNPADLKKLKQRLANAITIMTKDGSMQSEGTGRARRFFIKKP